MLIAVISALASASRAGEEIPVYPLGLDLSSETTSEGVASLLREEGWDVSTAEDSLSLSAERTGATLTMSWLDATYLRDVTYTEPWDDAWNCKERFAEWVEWFRFINGKPMVDTETFHYWNIPGMEVWFEITETGGGAATLTCSITFL
ncbi:MAG: hypothetical protein A2Y64_05320 [Candidatus Coatesbacteria bacterium RBG_13_66_14]|uniref:Uncharacterized protein n=1 Tax=Candidatus Coatesbacteria bacterium RBG_13_66_14 TaxID=1817816 RepID=A0A1F5EYK5_9BACT|nr:MAG: hypothetical protein A2Y64_05320 [Candidatus Coatesbacteria bacterium RBG_13_66_14]